MPTDGGRPHGESNHEDAAFGDPTDWDKNPMEVTDPGKEDVALQKEKQTGPKLFTRFVEGSSSISPANDREYAPDGSRPPKTKINDPVKGPLTDRAYGDILTSPGFPLGRTEIKIPSEVERTYYHKDHPPKLHTGPEEEREKGDRVETMPATEHAEMIGPYQTGRIVHQLKEDANAILYEQDHPERPFLRKSAEVFALIEADFLQESRISGNSPQKHRERRVIHVQSEGYRYVAAEARTLRDEFFEEELLTDARLEFDRMSSELKRLQQEGATEEQLFKKILAFVRSFPYRETANSMLQALAGRTRESLRPKPGIIKQLKNAKEAPALNCESRAKLFCSFLEEIGYSPRNDIYLSWPKNHVQTLIHRKDGTWLAFEGNNRRAFIQKFWEPTNVSTLQDWKAALYGVPKEEEQEPVDVNQPHPEAEAEEETPDAVSEAEEMKKEKPEKEEDTAEEDYAESKAAILVEEVSSRALEVISDIFGLFASKPDELERVGNAYPQFKPAEMVTFSFPRNPEQEAEERRRQEEAVRRQGALRKVVNARVANLMHAAKQTWRVALPMAAAGCYFGYGSLYRQEMAEEVDLPEEEKNWAEVLKAAGDDMEVTLVPQMETDEDWEARSARRVLDAPYTFGEFDLVIASHEGTIETQEVGGKRVRKIHVGDDVRVILPTAFQMMIEKDAQQQIESEETGKESVWVVEGAQLNLEATQRALSSVDRSDTFFVNRKDGYVGPKAFPLQETWILQNQKETEQVQIRWNVEDTGETTHSRRWGDLEGWSYEPASSADKRVLKGIGTISSHALRKTFGRGDFYVVVDAIPFEEKEQYLHDLP